jgi:hypothetical protein
MFCENGQVKRDDECLEYAGDAEKLGEQRQLVGKECNEETRDQLWIYDKGQILHNSGFCLALSEDRRFVYMDECSHNDSQMWKWHSAE